MRKVKRSAARPLEVVADGEGAALARARGGEDPPADARLEDLQVERHAARRERAADEAPAELRDAARAHALGAAGADPGANVERRRRARDEGVVARVGAVGQPQHARAARGHRELEAAVGAGRDAAAIDVLRAEAGLAHEDPHVGGADGLAVGALQRPADRRALAVGHGATRAQHEHGVTLLALAAEDLGREARDQPRAVTAVGAIQRPPRLHAERSADRRLAPGVGDAQEQRSVARDRRRSGDRLVLDVRAGRGRV